MEALRELDDAALVQLVKATQKQNHGGSHGVWGEYFKAKFPNLKFADPARHKRQTLLDFLEDILNQGEEESAGAAGDGKAAAAAAAKQFVARFAKWRRWYNQTKLATPQVPASAAAARGGEASTSEPSSDSQAALIWHLVHKTRSHPRFTDFYTFPSYSKGWAYIRKSASRAAPQMLALDCEMVKTDVDDNALVALCVVDETGAAVYKELVKPKGNVLDYRTALTGLTAADLEGVTTTLQDARKAVKALLNKGAVLVGHSLHNDLLSMKIDPHDIIDTALVFTYKDLPMASPGLKDLAKALLKLDMRKGVEGHHDSFEDAAVTMQLVLQELACGCTTKPLPPPEIKVPKEDLCKLLVHGIPRGVTEQDLRRLFPGRWASPAPAKEAEATVAASPEPGGSEPNGDAAAASAGPGSSASAAAAGGKKRKRGKEGGGGGEGGAGELRSFHTIEGKLSERKVHLVFEHAGHANAAFQRLRGAESVDSIGRATKTVQLVGRPGTLRVRKMACHNGLAFGRDKEASFKARQAAAAQAAQAALEAKAVSKPATAAVGGAPALAVSGKGKGVGKGSSVKGGVQKPKPAKGKAKGKSHGRGKKGKEQGKGKGQGSNGHGQANGQSGGAEAQAQRPVKVKIEPDVQAKRQKV